MTKIADMSFSGANEETSEIEVRSRRRVCENTKFDVFFEHIIDKRNGHEVPNFLVLAPKVRHDGMVTGVATLPICGNQIGLVRVHRPPLGEWCWEIPHGFMEPNENPEESALRELSEEAGIKALKAESLGLFAPDAGILSGRVHLFAVYCEKQFGDVTSELGLREFRWFEKEDFLAMLRNSVIQDSFTLSAWCRYLIKK